MSKNGRRYRSPDKTLPILDGMRVAKIRNSYFRPNTSNPNGFHHYIVYHDKTSGENRAILTTHLYNRDPARFRSLKRGDGIKIDLPGFETPSMILKKLYTRAGNGYPIDFSHGKVFVKASLSRSKARRVKAFIDSFTQNKTPSGASSKKK